MSTGLTNYCTWAGSVNVRLTAGGALTPYHVTAGHCGFLGTSTIFYNYAYLGSDLVPGTHFNIQVRRDSTTVIGAEWRNSLRRSGDAWGDFVLVNALSGNRSAYNLLMTSSSTTSRVISLMVVGVGSEVCISVPHIDTPKCDTVDDIGWVKDSNGKTFTHQAITRGSYDAEDGDSGGPLYLKGNPHLLVGVHQGSKRNLFGLEYQVFSQIGLIDDSPNMGIYNVHAVPTDGRRDFVQGMYYRNLNRIPDAQGYSYWRNTVLGVCNEVNAREVAYNFMNSIEFQNRYPITTGTYANKVHNARLRLWQVYRTYFGRNPDNVGLAYWLDAIMVANGIDISNAAANARWLDVLYAFSMSTEFSNRVNGPTSSVDGAICA